LAALFVDSWGQGAGYPRPELRQLEDALAVAITSARSSWPTVTLDDKRFISYLANRVEGGEPTAALTLLHVEDLYLACACLLNDRAAMMAFE
jgi:hypothetical protein